jgi:hypothetical protein
MVSASWEMAFAACGKRQVRKGFLGVTIVRCVSDILVCWMALAAESEETP